MDAAAQPRPAKGPRGGFPRRLPFPSSLISARFGTKLSLSLPPSLPPSLPLPLSHTHTHTTSGTLLTPLSALQHTARCAPSPTDPSRSGAGRLRPSRPSRRGGFVRVGLSVASDGVVAALGGGLGAAAAAALGEVLLVVILRRVEDLGVRGGGGPGHGAERERERERERESESERES